MAIEYCWLIDEQVVFTKMRGQVVAAEFQKWADELNPFYDIIAYDRLHLIIDASELEETPTIKEMLNIPVHEKRGWVIIVGMSNQLLQFLASLVVQMTRTELKFVRTLDEALVLLGRVDLALQTDNPNEQECIPVEHTEAV